MPAVRVGTYNLLDLGKTGSLDQCDRMYRIVQVIRQLNVNILCVQEIVAPDDASAGHRLQELAEATGMDCTLAPDKPAVAAAHRLAGLDLHFYVGLLWRDVDPVPDRFASYGEDFWHNTAVLQFDLGEHRVRVGSHHSAPFGKHRRADEAERLKAIFTRPDGRPPGIIGGDFNAVGADRLPDGTLYDPDPYLNVPWHDDFVHQTHWEHDQDGARRWWADRTPSEILYAGGLYDAAAAIKAPWQATVGHWPTNDPFGERRIDTILVTRELVPALQSVEAIRTELTLAASDHLPVVATVDRDALGDVA